MNPLALIFLIFIGLALLIIGAKTLVVIKPDERAVVFRLERFLTVHSPGLVVIVPFLDKVVKVRAEQIAGSQQMTEAQLLARIAEIYQNE